MGGMGVKLRLPISNNVPPEAAEYQSTVFPGSTETVRAGMGAPSQIVGLLDIVGVLTGAQLQFGAFTTCINTQPVIVSVLEMVTVESAVIPVTVKFPPLPVTVPAEAVTTVPFVVNTTS